MKSHPNTMVDRKEVEDQPVLELQFSAKLKKRVGKDLIALYKTSRSLLLLIPNMIKYAATEDVRAALQHQFEAVQQQVNKLEALFTRMEEKPKQVLTRTPTWMAGFSSAGRF